MPVEAAAGADGPGRVLLVNAGKSKVSNRVRRAITGKRSAAPALILYVRSFGLQPRGRVICGEAARAPSQATPAATHHMAV
jgi:hypothetical protein